MERRLSCLWKEGMARVVIEACPRSLHALSGLSHWSGRGWEVGWYALSQCAEGAAQRHAAALPPVALTAVLNLLGRSDHG